MPLKKSDDFISDDEFSNPIDISDLLDICKEYSNSGSKIQSHIQRIYDEGFEYAVQFMEPESLPFIKSYFEKISKNPLFGDACCQANDIVLRINQHYVKIKKCFDN